MEDENKYHKPGLQRSVSFIDRQNHDRDVTTIDATMSLHEMLFPEIPCLFGNCKAWYRLGLSVIKQLPILDHNQHIPAATSCLIIFVRYLEYCAGRFYLG